MGKLKLENVTKRFGDVTAAENVSLSIEDGELLVLVGPSGCGKTTTLRMIAGLETPTEGRIWIGDEDVTDTIPKYRDIAMVFQDLALYPHMTVRGNLEFPLKMEGIDEAVRNEKVTDAAEILEIPELLDRRPGALSGGQQQRVALGRALVREPQVFLMDEPLSSLDAQLRETMRSEILSLHQSLGQTMVYVTHDQEIALTLGDKIAVMRDGTLQQLASPNTIYKRPANQFVARFIGSPDMNFFEATVEAADGKLTLQTDSFELEIREGIQREGLESLELDQVDVAIRPQDIYLADQIAQPSEERETVEGNVSIVERLGSVADIHVDSGGDEFVARVDGDTNVGNGNRITLVFDTTKLHFFDLETGERITDVDPVLTETSSSVTEEEITDQ